MKKLFALLVIFAFIALCAVLGGGKAGASTMGYAWPHNGRSWPVVMVQNDTHTSDFPIKEAVRRWGTPMHYGRCVSGKACVHVTEKHWGNNGISGLTPTGHFGSRIVNATVELNRYYTRYGRYAGSYGYALQTAMHELGHSVGLNHDSGSGCMRAAISGGYTNVSSYERSELRRIYGM